MATVRKNRGRYVADFVDQHGHRRIEAPKGLFETKAQEKLAADALLKRRLEEVGGNTFVSAQERPTFKELAKLWIESKVRIGDTTLSDYNTMLDCFLLPYFGPRKAEQLKLLDFETFRSDMTKGLPEACRLSREARFKAMQAEDPKAYLKPLKNPGTRTINKCLAVIISITRYGKKVSLLPKDVSEGLEKLPSVEGEDRCIEMNVLTPGEILDTIEHSNDPYRIPTAIAGYTGARQEEVLGLKWTDFASDFSTAEIKRVYRRGRFSKPKTKSSLRTIEIPVELREMLREWQPRCPRNEHNLVCPSVRGKPMPAATLLRNFQQALARAGVRRVRFHDLRHSFASNLLAALVDIVTVSKALGHANVQITLTTYAHAIPKPRQGASDKMAELMRASGGRPQPPRPDCSGPELRAAA